MEWSDYIAKAAKHSKHNARHWFRYLRKDIDKFGIKFTENDVYNLYNSKFLTPFQRVSIKAAFKDGSQTHQYLTNLNKKRTNFSKISLVKVKYDESNTY